MPADLHGAGGLGYELYPSADIAVDVFDALLDARQVLGVRMAGYQALESLRSESGVHDLVLDLGPTSDPYSAGLSSAVALDKDGGFIGPRRAPKARPDSPPYRTVHVAIDDPEPLFFHDESVLLNGMPVGRMTSGNYGYTLGRAVGLAAIATDADHAGARPGG